MPKLSKTAYLTQIYDNILTDINKYKTKQKYIDKNLCAYTKGIIFAPVKTNELNEAYHQATRSKFRGISPQRIL